MEADTAVRTHCTSCDAPYRVPEHFIGKRIACKKCGVSFELVHHHGDGDHQVIGRLAVKYHIIDNRQYAEVLAAQRAERNKGCRVNFEDILVEKGLISSRQLSRLCRTRDFLEIRKKDKHRGAIMVEKGFCSQDQVDQALSDQSERFKRTHTIRRIDDILIEAGILTCMPDDPDVADKEGPGPKKTDDPSWFSLTVSDDRLSAFLKPNGEMNHPPTLSGVKSFLETEGIIHGIAADESIRSFLENATHSDKPFKIAEGTAPVPGKDAVVQYHVDIECLKPDPTQADAAAKNLSPVDIPAVKAGDVIAEKLPPVPAIPGMDVFGQPIPVATVTDDALRCGEGAKRSEDGTRIIATVSGQPDIASTGEIRVLSELNFPGDLDSHGGPILFGGHINVGGSIKPGLTIKGRSLTAAEIAGAEIDVIDSVTVTNGIVDTRIQAQGHVDAKYIKGASLFVAGDVSVGKEIINSEISAGGRCAIPQGKILASVVSAGNGIVAGEIGSEMSNPTTLRPGVDVYAEKELAELETAIEEEERRLEQREAAKGDLDLRNKGLHKKIAALAQAVDRTILTRRSLQGKMEEMAEHGQSPERDAAEAQLKRLDENEKKAEAMLSRLFDQQDAICEKIESISGGIEAARGAIEKLHTDADAVSKRREGEKHRATVTVHRAVFEGTIISGIRARKVLPATYKNVLIAEVKQKDPGSEVKWTFQAFPQKRRDIDSRRSQFNGA